MAREDLRPSFKILLSLIQIWDVAEGESLIMEPKNPMMFTEVESIDIDDSYKKLCNTATVRFPKGTVVRKTITTENVDDTQVTASIEDSGVLATVRSTTRRVNISGEFKDFRVGQRIRIRLGYTTDPYMLSLTRGHKNIYNDRALLEKYIAAMVPPNGNSSAIMFDGYITKCSIDEPIELECEDLASYLKKITCPHIAPSQNWTVNDFLADDGRFKLLEKSGLKLHPANYNRKIDIGKVEVPADFTVADVLLNWADDAHLYSYVKLDNDGNPCLAVGWAYYSGDGSDSVIQDISADVPEIDFAYHVADNNVTQMNTDKAFLAVKAQSLETGAGKKYSITVRQNPDYNPSVEGSKKYQIINETKLSKKAIQAGATSLTGNADKVDLSSYNIVPYVSRKLGISHEELQMEAIRYFESYNANGIEGSLTLFGDYNLKSGTKVHLTDNRFPQKNGYYLIEEVVTKFGTSGYRQTIKLPHCISRDNQ